MINSEARKIRSVLILTLTHALLEAEINKSLLLYKDDSVTTSDTSSILVPFCDLVLALST